MPDRALTEGITIIESVWHGAPISAQPNTSDYVQCEVRSRQAAAEDTTRIGKHRRDFTRAITSQPIERSIRTLPNRLGPDGYETALMRSLVNGFGWQGMAAPLEPLLQR